ncbi:MAG TPA: zinc-dependent metalloprotease [Acidimicrobiales bacterium]|jgi:putative hydrolase|nr:zinc-dependent metalloprotease [Acidimicrobiales bacterium]
MFGSNDPDNPMGGLLGDLLKVIGSSQGSPGNSWFDAARTLAHGVATDGQPDQNADPLVRIAYEDVTRVAELHVANATGIALTSGGTAVSFDTVGRGQWSALALAAYRPTLQQMVEAQQQGAAAVPPLLNADDLGDDPTGGLGNLLGQFAVTLGPVLLGMQFGSAAGHLAQRAFGQYALPLPWPESNTLLLVPENVAQFAEDWSLPLQEVQLWVCLRELAMHAVMTRPAVRASVTTLLADATSHAAASQRSMVERLGDGLGDPGALENVLSDPEALLADLISPEQQHISNALTALTTAIGAYADHVTAGIAATLTSSPAALREAWYRYRIEEGKGEQAFAGLFGLNVGRAEVDRGKNFIDGVVERAGEDALARLWGDDLDLPTPNEVDAPGLWLARIGLLD